MVFKDDYSDGNKTQDERARKGTLNVGGEQGRTSFK